MPKKPEHPSYAPLTGEPEGAGPDSDRYLYSINKHNGTVLCPAHARQLRAGGTQVKVIRESDGQCAECNKGANNDERNEPNHHSNHNRKMAPSQPELPLLL
jgi:hypothetical protein